MDLRDDLQLSHKIVNLWKHHPLHSAKGRGGQREKQSPREGTALGNPVLLLSHSQLLLAFLNLCTFKPTILELQEYPNHDICVKMKGMQMFGFFYLDLEILFSSK